MDSSTVWNMIHAYFGKDELSKLVEHQIDSYNDFVFNRIPYIIESMNPITVWNEYVESANKYRYEIQMHIGSRTFQKPKMRETSGQVKTLIPSESRNRNYTYNAGMFVDITIVIREYEGEKMEKIKSSVDYKFTDVPYGKIPVMIGSKLCVLNDAKVPHSTLKECSRDPGGYFIINGGERVILAQEKVADNRIMVYINKKQPKFPVSVEVKSLSEIQPLTPKKLELKISSKFNGMGYPIYAVVPKISVEIPVCILFRALGIETDSSILKLIFRDLSLKGFEDAMMVFQGSVLEAGSMGIYTTETAKEYLSKHCMNSLDDILTNELLPHCGGNKKSQVYVISQMIRRMINVFLEKSKPDDRDAYINKRVVIAGTLLTQRFRQLYQKVVKEMKSKLNHEANQGLWKKTNDHTKVVNKTNLLKIIRMSVLETKLQRSLGTGNFGGDTAGSSTTKNGVSQVLNRLSFNATISHLRRIQTPVEKSGKLLAPRKLHGTSWGYICPAETPEGATVGIVKAISMMASITMGSSAKLILESLNGNPLITPMAVKDLDSLDAWDVVITVNSAPIGFTRKPVELMNQLKSKKHSGLWNPYTGLAWFVSKGIIEIETDMGRFVRPTLRVPIALPKPGASWPEIVRDCIEYISPLEAETSLIAIDKNELSLGLKPTEDGLIRRYTHCELDPSLILGHMASIIPFSDHNQSPRNCYSSSMSKQAVGWYVSNYMDRFEKNGYLLVSPNKPLVSTRMYDLLNLDKTPYGMNAIVAFASMTGYNQEDSVILNEGFVKRGAFHSMYYTTYRDDEHLNIHTGKDEHFTKPNPVNTKGYMKDASYEGLQSDGAPRLNAVLNPEDAVIGKVIATRDGGMYKDSSTIYKGSETARVDAVHKSRNADGYPSIKVRLASYRVPEIGNKLASVHAQKGTIGMILPEADMPFTAEGIRPDIIMNPHAIPSRMTIGMVMEMLMGKSCVEFGTFGDGTPFEHLDQRTIQDLLLKAGYLDTGDEVLYNGQTGEQLKVRIFMCPINYMALKHMVRDKMHSRPSGRVVLLTRQPCEGRSRDGGLRVGEMERDCLISHGASMFVKERLMDVSDAYDTYICKKCGGMPIFNTMDKTSECPKCNNITEFSQVRMPYAMKLLQQEMSSMCIESRILTGEC